jgi:excisionase family DNA binding protein
MKEINEKLLNTREAAHILKISEKEIIDLADAGKISHYKVAEEFLRFKREDILTFREVLKQKYPHHQTSTVSLLDQISDFFYFNDFYIISLGLIIFLLAMILKDFFVL